MNDKKLQKAIDYYTGMGWAIFPVHSITAEGNCSCGQTDCKSQGKHPRTANGFKSATNDQEAAHKLFENYRSANIGVATGAASGVWVLDVDGERGLADLNALGQRYGELPETPVAATGGGGKHLFFSATGESLQNSTRIEGGLSIDVRGNGGYVVVPPSDHLSGNPYEWAIRPDEKEPAQAPDWLIGLVTGDTPLISLPPAFNSSHQVLRDLVYQGRFDELPGVPEGQRHDTALQWVGYALSQGIPSQVILDLGKRWCRKCDPPMKWKEFARIVYDLAARDEKKRMEGVSFHLPEELQKPVLGDDAYYGILGDIVNKIRPETESDPAALLVQFLVMVGNMIGRKPFYDIGGTHHHTNLFAVMVGRTSGGRKGTSLGKVRSILKGLDSDYVASCIKSGLTSGEGLIYHVRDTSPQGSGASGQVLPTTAGIIDKRLMAVESEFSSVLKAMGRQQNTLSPVIRSAWDTGDLSTLAKNSPVRATDAHVSLIGHITAEELKIRLNDTESFNGFANRFLWCLTERTQLLPDGGQHVDLSEEVGQLAMAIGHASNLGQMKRSEAVREVWHAFYKRTAESKPGLLGAVTDRAAPQAVRLAMIYALIDGTSTIDACHKRAAIAVWDYCEASARVIFGQRTGDKLTDQVYDIICDHPGGISRENICNPRLKNRPRRQVALSLQRLESWGYIRKTMNPHTNGRPAEIWFPVSR